MITSVLIVFVNVTNSETICTMRKAKKYSNNMILEFLNLIFQVNFDETVMEKSLMSVSELDPLPSSRESQFDINELVEFPVLSCVPITREQFFY